MENKCPICIDESHCDLREGLQSQAQIGGFKDKSLDRTKGTGPYWKESSWNGFTERTKKATEGGCLHPDEVKEFADKVTREKKAAGELI